MTHFEVKLMKVNDAKHEICYFFGKINNLVTKITHTTI